MRARPGLQGALAAALARVAPHLRGGAFEREVAWQVAEVRLSARAPGLVAWATMPLGRLLRVRLAEAQNWRCCWCGRAMDPHAEDTAARPTFEHVVPSRDGGAAHPDNLAIACRACSQERSRVDPRGGASPRAAFASPPRPEAATVDPGSGRGR